MHDPMIVPPIDERPWRVSEAKLLGHIRLIELAPIDEHLAAPTETLMILGTEAPYLPSMETFIEAARQSLGLAVTTGTTSLRVVSSSEQECTYVAHINNDIVSGNRTEITRVLRLNSVIFNIQYTVERRLPEDTLQAWISRISKTEAFPGVFERLADECARFRRQTNDWLAEERAKKSSAASLAGQIDHARLAMLSTDKHADVGQWIQATSEFGRLCTNLMALLEAKDFESDEILSLIAEGTQCLRHATHGAIQSGIEDFWLPQYESLATAYLFDCSDSRKESLERSAAGFQFLIDKGLGAQSLQETYLVKKAIALVNQSIFEGEQLLDRALALLFHSLQGDKSFESFQLLMAMGYTWLGAADRISASFHRDALAFFDFAETFGKSADFSRITSSDLESGKPPNKAFFESLISARMAQKRVQVFFQGADVVEHETPMKVDHVGALLFLRPLDSSRRFPLPNRFKPSNRLIEYEKEPPHLSLEACLQRALLYRFATNRSGGPSDSLGMGDISSYLSPGNTAQAGAQEHWQNFLEPMMISSAIVLILLWDSKGVLWEVSEVLSRFPEKCVLLMLPEDLSKGTSQAWEAARNQLATNGFEIPPYSSAGGFFIYGPSATVSHHLEFSAIWSETLAEELAKHALKFKE